MILRPASQLKSVPVEWLWPGYLVAGSLAILDGDGGLGKSLLTLDLCCRLTHGAPFCNGAPGVEPCNVLLLCSEDPERVILERLQLLGADMDRVFPWTRESETGLPAFPKQIDRLETELKDVRPRLAVIDPIASFLDARVNLAVEASVRRALEPLQALAEKYECVILLVRHLNKTRGNHALYRGMNSVAFVSMCRTGWLAGPDPRDLSRYVLAQNKNNYAPLQPSLSYGFSKGSPRIEWFGQSLWTADTLARGCRLRPRLRAIQFLRRFLQAGARTSNELTEAALAHGFSTGTLRRARKQMALRHAKVIVNGKQLTYCLLPAQPLPKETIEGSGTEELDESLRKLEEEFPPMADVKED